MSPSACASASFSRSTSVCCTAARVWRGRVGRIGGGWGSQVASRRAAADSCLGSDVSCQTAAASRLLPTSLSSRQASPTACTHPPTIVAIVAAAGAPPAALPEGRCVVLPIQKCDVQAVQAGHTAASQVLDIGCGGTCRSSSGGWSVGGRGRLVRHVVVVLVVLVLLPPLLLLRPQQLNALAVSACTTPRAAWPTDRPAPPVPACCRGPSRR